MVGSSRSGRAAHVQYDNEDEEEESTAEDPQSRQTAIATSLMNKIRDQVPYIVSDITSRLY